MARRHVTYEHLKRTGDLVAAVVLLVVLAPVLVLLMGLIFVESGRPVLFRQVRVGRHGRPFILYKLRTLRPGRHDPERPNVHVTRVGRMLRRWGIDELPQLWNVLRGDMSIIGPRPTLPEQVAAYGPFERRRLEVRPGLTGWAQIHGRNALSWAKRIRLDVWYVDHVSPRLDLHILLRTPRILLYGTGIYGRDGRNPGYGNQSDAQVFRTRSSRRSSPEPLQRA